MESVWKKTAEIPSREKLKENIHTKAVVIGAGMTGILTAYMLQEQGVETVVLEAGRIAGGQTCNTTAKITSQHNLIYAYLMEKFGEEKAAMYAHANQQAIEDYARIIEKEKIACDFQRKPAYLYSREKERIEELENEAKWATLLGIPAEFVTETELPFPVAGAVRFANQGHFHPLKFIGKIAEKLTIYEESRVVRLKDNCAFTEHGMAEGEHVIFAVHYPWQIVPGYYFLRMHQERSYVIALDISEWEKIDGMYLGIEPEGYSFRTMEKDGKRILLLGGGSHRTGENTSGERYELLRKKAEEWFPKSREIAHWSAQDCMPMDKIPYIGYFSSEIPNWYVATGFGKWGMTSAMAAASVIRDMVLGKEHEDEKVYAPQRFPVSALSKKFTENTIQAVKGLTKQAVSAQEFPGKCTHMGCKLEKNADEGTWECPCHGSCFTNEGELLHGPAQYGFELLQKD